jgi:hypothetical protein
MFTPSLLLNSGSQVEWSLPLMVAWLVVALTLSVVEVLWLTAQPEKSPLRTE